MASLAEKRMPDAEDDHVGQSRADLNPADPNLVDPLAQGFTNGCAVWIGSSFVLENCPRGHCRERKGPACHAQRGGRVRLFIQFVLAFWP